MSRLGRLQRAGLLIGLLGCALLQGCATPQVAHIRNAGVASNLPVKTGVLDVPFFAQNEFECGPAALAMVMGAAGVSVQPDDLVEQVYLPARKGSLQVEMLAATRQRGLLPYVLRPQIEDLLRELAAGHPVLVFQNLSLSIYPVWHYAVAVAYNLERNTITLHSGETERMEMSLFAFERTWSRAEFWAMLALQPNQLPVSADAAAMARAIAPLEATQLASARTAYRAALRRWPEQAQLWFGLGNSNYGLGDKEAAIDAYQASVRDRPDFADAWNNLAQTQLDLGRLAAARESIGRAVALGGVRAAQYQQLQATVAATAQP